MKKLEASLKTEHGRRQPRRRRQCSRAVAISTARDRAAAWLVGCFAALAALLGVVGPYGFVAYSVSQRTREIGMRMALGAPLWKICGLVHKEACRLTVLGVAAGVLCSVAILSLMGKLLFQVKAWDLPTLASVSLALGLAALLASYLPAHRAASVDPVEALRAE